MTVSGPFIDPRKPGLPYCVKIRYGRTNSLVEFHRFPSEGMAIAARKDIEQHGLGGPGWPTHTRPS